MERIPLPGFESSTTLAPPPRPTKTPTPLSRREREKRKRLLRRLAKVMRNPPRKFTEDLNDLIERMNRSGIRLPEQRVLAIRWRRAGASGEIKRRIHEKPGNDVFQDLSTAGAVKLQIKIFQDSVTRLTQGELTDEDVADTWAWIDREPNPANPFDYRTCLEVYAQHVDRDPDWINDGVQRLRPTWLLDHTMKPKAYATYWIAYVLG